MGAGAGYNIKGTIDTDSIKINNFSVKDIFTTTEDFGDGYSQTYQVIQIKCDIDCKVEDVTSESYYYGGTLYGLTPIKITEISLIPYGDDIEDISEITEDIIWYALRNLQFNVSVGGGWIHSTFNGDLSCDGEKLNEDSYNDFYFNEIVMYITNEDAIKALDEYALGDNYSDEYKVVDIDGEDMDYFDDYDEAVKWAKENNGYQVWGNRVWYEYSITNSGEIESDVLDFDDEIGKDWTNPNYIDEDF